MVSAMLFHYLKIAVRMLNRQRGYAIISVAGLAVGIGCSLLILLFVLHELSYDRFHENADRLFQLVRIDQNGEHNAYGPADAARLVEETFLEVEGSTYVSSSAQEFPVSADEQAFFDARILKTFANFFDLFSFGAVHDNLDAALREPASVVLTESTALRLFGPENPVGRPLVVRNETRGEVTQSEMHHLGNARLGHMTFEWSDATYTVTAVIEDVPSTSTLQFDLLASPRTDEAMYWGRGFVMLREGTNVRELEEKLSATDISPTTNETGYRLRPLTSIHLHPDWPESSARTGPLAYLYIFSVVAMAVLLIACINYINLATARSARRAREIGQRKVVGASRSQIAAQFLGESTVLAVISTGCALLLAQMALPHLNALLGTGISLSMLGGGELAAIILFLSVVVALLSGSLPALVLSRMSMVPILKGSLGHATSGAALRKSLVITQFAACTVLGLATIIAHQQMEFIRESRLNVRGDEVLVISTQKSGMGGGYDAFRTALMSRPEILSVASGPPPGTGGMSVGMDVDADGTFEQVRVAFADENFFETLQIELKEGVGFETESGDHIAQNAVVINETAAQLLGGGDLLGAQIEQLAPATVAGVIEDYHFMSLHESIGPLVIAYSPTIRDPILVRLRSGAIVDGLAAVQDVWSDFVPDEPLEYGFLDERLDEAYRTELRMTGLLGAFAVLILFVAALGLFGLAAFTAEQRTKEIGIRKVLGASVSGLVALLSKDFVQLVLVAFVLGAPVAYVLMYRWLEDFAYRVEISMGTMVAVGSVAVVVALATVSVQAVRAAVADPVKTLRYE